MEQINLVVLILILMKKMIMNCLHSQINKFHDIIIIFPFFSIIFIFIYFNSFLYNFV